MLSESYSVSPLPGFQPNYYFFSFFAYRKEVYHPIIFRRQKIVALAELWQYINYPPSFSAEYRAIFYRAIADDPQMAVDEASANPPVNLIYGSGSIDSSDKIAVEVPRLVDRLNMYFPQTPASLPPLPIQHSIPMPILISILLSLQEVMMVVTETCTGM